jgi:hypothetical protein
MASPAKPEFDGPNRRIILASGVTLVDVQPDLYSQWKEWVALDDNMKYPPAFRTIGGDPLTASITAGSYYFLQNQDGYDWRIRPPEEDINILLTGSLAAEDPDRDIVVPTLGGFTALVLGLQPITQGADALIALQQTFTYADRVWIDTISGTSGTNFPNGTASQPVSNLADAITIANEQGITHFMVRGSITLTQNFTSWIIHGVGSHDFGTVDLNGFAVDQTVFKDVTITGAGQGGTVACTNCRLTNFSNLTGEFIDCHLPNTITLTDGDYVFVRPVSEVAGTGKPIMDCNNAAVDVSIRGLIGGLDIINFGGSSPEPVMTIDVISGAPRLNASCTTGEIVVRGVGDLTDNSAGTIVIRDGWTDGKELKLIRALVAGNAVVSSDDLTITVYDPDDTGSPGTVLATYSISADGRVRTRVT